METLIPIVVALLGSGALVALLRLLGRLLERSLPPPRKPAGPVIDDYERLVDQLQQEVGRLAARMQALEDSEGRLRAELERAWARIDELTAENRQLRLQISGLSNG